MTATAPKKRIVSPSKKRARKAAPKRVKTKAVNRDVYPWGEMRTAYVTPTLSEDGSKARWPTLEEIAVRFHCNPVTVREHSASEGWVAAQRAAEDAFWVEQALELNRRMAHRSASLRMGAFNAAVLGINKSQALLNGNVDSSGLQRAVSAASASLDMGLRAVGVRPDAAPGFGLAVNFQNYLGIVPSLPTMPAPGDGGSGPDPQPDAGPVSLWAFLIRGQRSNHASAAAPPAAPGPINVTPPGADPFDLPSPLPPHLSAGASTR